MGNSLFSNHKITSKSAHVIIEGRIIGQSSNFSSKGLLLIMEKAEVKKLLSQVRT